MDWRRIPSLSALRAYECAARLGSYSAAARELNVTHAAIAQHVRALEAHLGVSLMHRVGQGMQTTPEGAQLARTLTVGFGTIADGVEALHKDTATRALRIATTPSFAENWLVPRIGAFWSRHPEIGVEIVPGNASVDLRRDGFDLALRFGRGGWPGTEHEPLVDANHTIVAAPGLILHDRIKDVSDLRAATWIFVRGRAEERVWMVEIGLPADTLACRDFDTAAMALQAVRAGAGVSVQPRPVVERDIATGALVALHHADGGSNAYHIVWPKGALSPRTRTFVRWLRKQV